MVAFIELIVSFAFGWCLWSLSGYHCFLLSQNMTTNEQIKQTGCPTVSFAVRPTDNPTMSRRDG